MKKINRLKVVLVEQRKTGKWLAEQLGKDPSTISKWCSNTTQPPLDMYNPQIQISAESGTKRSIFRQKNKTKRSKKRLHTTLIKPEQKVNEDLCSGFVLS